MNWFKRRKYSRLNRQLAAQGTDGRWVEWFKGDWRYVSTVTLDEPFPSLREAPTIEHESIVTDKIEMPLPSGRMLYLTRVQTDIPVQDDDVLIDKVVTLDDGSRVRITDIALDEEPPLARPPRRF